MAQTSYVLHFETIQSLAIISSSDEAENDGFELN